jgi:hypothetical protein
MIVTLTLPDATPFDAQVFGLWLRAMLDGAREVGDLTTVVTTITLSEE